jgi:hypothetical protein
MKSSLFWDTIPGIPCESPQKPCFMPASCWFLAWHTYSSTLKKEAVYFSETLVVFLRTIPEDRTVHSHFCENLQIKNVSCVLLLPNARRSDMAREQRRLNGVSLQPRMMWTSQSCIICQSIGFYTSKKKMSMFYDCVKVIHTFFRFARREGFL